MVERRSPIGAALRGAGFAASLVALAAAAEWLATAGLLSQHWIDVTVAGHGLAGAASFLAVGALATALGLPRQMIAFLGGYAFGAVVGTELALAAAVLGCIVTFGYARLAASTLVARRFATHVQRLDTVLNAAPFHMTLVVRLLPVGSNLLTNLVAGVTRVRFGPFVAGSAVGYLPQTLAFALAGSGIHVAPVLSFALAGVLLAVSAVVGIRLYRRHRDAAEVEDALAPHGPPASTA